MPKKMHKISIDFLLSLTRFKPLCSFCISNNPSILVALNPANSLRRCRPLSSRHPDGFAARTMSVSLPTVLPVGVASSPSEFLCIHPEKPLVDLQAVCQPASSWKILNNSFSMQDIPPTRMLLHFAPNTTPFTSLLLTIGSRKAGRALQSLSFTLS